MAFNAKSRYARQPLQMMTDARGRLVNVVVPPDALQQELLGYHLRRQGERLDHLAQRYLDDATTYWRIAEFNDVMAADMLAEADEIAIPAP